MVNVLGNLERQKSAGMLTHLGPRPVQWKSQRRWQVSQDSAPRLQRLFQFRSGKLLALERCIVPEAGTGGAQRRRLSLPKSRVQRRQLFLEDAQGPPIRNDVMEREEEH